jgi:hypothetical protein
LTARAAFTPPAQQGLVERHRHESRLAVTGHDGQFARLRIPHQFIGTVAQVVKAEGHL